jgi:predicted flap endonuclease-1-like 5' DNA nuclease
MSNSPDDGEGVPEEVPDAVLGWLRAVADERDVSETELLRSLVSGGPAGGADASGGGVDEAELERVQREFRELVEDVRDRIVQVKRETDEKAPAEHTHDDLRSTLDQVGREIEALEQEVDRLDDRLAAGFENYEEILTHLTDTTDELDRKLGRLASVLIDLRDQVGEAARDEVRRTALRQLTDTANRHGVERAKCEDCGEGVHVGMLIEPRCPHCDASFSALEPKGLFRTSVLHTGTVPALESGGEAAEAEATSLEAMVEDADGAEEPSAPTFETETPEEPAEPESETAAETGAAATENEPGQAAEESEPDTSPEQDGLGDLESIDGIGPTYAERLESAGVDDVLALADADPQDLADAIGVPTATVADWVVQADARTS